MVVADQRLFACPFGFGAIATLVYMHRVVVGRSIPQCLYRMGIRRSSTDRFRCELVISFPWYKSEPGTYLFLPDGHLGRAASKSQTLGRVWPSGPPWSTQSTHEPLHSRTLQFKLHDPGTLKSCIRGLCQSKARLWMAKVVSVW